MAQPQAIVLIGDSNDQASFALEELGLYGGNRNCSVLAFGFDHVCLHVSLRDHFDRTKGLASIFSIVDMRDFLAIDLEATFGPERDIYNQFVVAERRDEMLSVSSATPSHASFS